MLVTLADAGDCDAPDMSDSASLPLLVATGLLVCLEPVEVWLEEEVFAG